MLAADFPRYSARVSQAGSWEPAFSHRKSGLMRLKGSVFNRRNFEFQGQYNESGYSFSGGYLYRRRCFSRLVFCQRLCGSGRRVMKKSTILMIIIAVIALAGVQFGWW